MLESGEHGAVLHGAPDRRVPDLSFDVAADAVSRDANVRITLSTTLEIAVEDRRIETHRVAVAHLRADLPAAISLRNALNQAIVLAMPGGRDAD